MSKAIGIDLGTTNSAVALKKISTEILSNSEGELLTPSVVSIQTNKGILNKKRQLLTGKSALDWMRQDPKNTIVSVKRLMGRGFSDSEIKLMLQQKRFDYEIKAPSGSSDNSLCVVLDKQEYTPEQISAKIIEKIKNDSEKQIGENIDYAVVTVPSYFNDKQKVATRRAAALAAIKVLRLLPEPTAAAISFGVDNLQAGEAKTVLVYDLGGGTFDISILTIAEGQFIEQGKGGDMWMGGDDIDNLIRQYIYAETEQEYEIDDLNILIDHLKASDKNRFLGEIKHKVEQAKVKLSSHDTAHIDILGLLKDEEGDIVDIDVELQREKFEQLLTPFVERTISLSKQLLADINFELDLIDQVILVGGSSSIPLVIEEIRALFGAEKVLLHPRPMLAIAEGAAILAHRLSDFYECPQCGHEVAQNDKICSACQFNLEDNLIETGLLDIVHTCSHDYYLELEGGKSHKLAEQNTALPFQTQSSFKLVHHEQRLAHLRFFNHVNGKPESIGALWLCFNFSPSATEINKDKLPEIILDFEVDINNLITVAASLKDHPETKISKTLSRGGSDEQLFIELEASIEAVNKEQKGYYEVHEFLQRTLKIADQINQLIDSETGSMNKTLYNKIIKMRDIAQSIYDNNESFQGNINYASSFIDEFGHLLTKDEQAALKKRLHRFKEKTKTAELDEIVTARKALFYELDKHPLLGSLQAIANAAEIVAQNDPNQYEYFQKYINDISKSIEADDIAAINKLLGEIMPEVNNILDQQDNKKLHIFKEVQL